MKKKKARKNREMKVKQFYNKNQFVIIDNENKKTYFQSYNSLIAFIDESGNLTLGKDWNYSTTTAKHLYLFIDEFCYSYKVEIPEGCKNKRAYIQKLIDDGIINYDENME